jgi:predicted neuraminidase
MMLAEFLFAHAPFAACHAATIVGTGDRMIAAWFAGEEEGRKDVAIWTSRHDGRGWSDVREVATGLQENGKRYACWNPVLYTAADKTTLLFFKVGKSPRNWWGMLTRSNDEGNTWSQPERLPDDILGPVKNKPVLLSDGVLLCGPSAEQKGWTVHIEMTPDLGKTWAKTGPLNNGRKLAAIQPTIFNYPSGELQILCRTRQGG